MFQVFSKETSEFLRKSINFVLNEREQSGSKRQDLIDTLLILKNEDEGKSQNGAAGIGLLKKFQMNRFQVILLIVFQGDVLVAQAAAFFTAGYETSSSVMSFALYELCWKVITYSVSKRDSFFKIFIISARSSEETQSRN